MKPNKLTWAALPAFALAAAAACAQDVVLKIHHFLPPGATIQKQVFEPWCDKIGKESGGRK
jgi:TRAP-type transport system periplasmic protein